MTQHDYKAALELFERRWEGYGNVRKTIRHALLLADKVRLGSTDEMVKAFFSQVEITREGSIINFDAGFKAMIQQAEREIG